MAEMMNPETTICVVKTEDGREVGRVPAAAPNAEAYITELVRQYGSVHVDYVHDEDAWLFTALNRRL